MKSTNIQRIGVISDTHSLMRPQALEALKGSELILHAGDVGDAQVLEQLRTLAPVVAVRGNVDTGAWGESLPLTQEIEVGKIRLYMLHKISDLELDPAAVGFSVVVYGHSHKAIAQTKNGVLYLNPGAAGPRRFDLPITVAKLRLEGKEIEAEIEQIKV